MLPLIAILSAWERVRTIAEIALVGATAWATVEERRQDRADRERDAVIADLQRQIAWLQMNQGQQNPPAPPERRKTRVKRDD